MICNMFLPWCCALFPFWSLFSAGSFEFEMFVLWFIFWLNENAPELSWLTSSQFEVGGVAMPEMVWQQFMTWLSKMGNYLKKMIEEYDVIIYIPSENPESPAASRSKSLSSEDEIWPVPNLENTTLLFSIVHI